MKLFIVVALLVSAVFGSQIKVSDDLKSIKIKDQFEKDMRVLNDTSRIIVAFSKEKGEEIKSFLDANPNYLSKNNMLYFADVSAAPSFVTSLFMIPKFKKYPFSMGIITDEDLAATFPKQEGMITVLHLKNAKVNKIEYIKSL
jgi:hypothetical protein